MDQTVGTNCASQVVIVRGEVDLASASNLRDNIERARQAGDERALVIDVQGVTFIDSTGLSELLRPAIAGYSVTLVRPSRAVQTMLDLAGVSELFAVSS